MSQILVFVIILHVLLHIYFEYKGIKSDHVYIDSHDTKQDHMFVNTLSYLALLTVIQMFMHLNYFFYMIIHTMQ